MIAISYKCCTFAAEKRMWGVKSKEIIQSCFRFI